MCGIAGIYNSKDSNLVHNMLDAMGHRGRDLRTVEFTSNAYIGHNLMNITSDNGDQPKHSGKWMVWLNGCIYNIKGYPFRKDLNDTQQLAELFNEYGIDAVKDINGMFVIVAYDGENYYIIRDRYGIKPFYYWKNGEEIVFSSEIKAILRHPDYTVRVDKEALHEYFTYQYPLMSRTLFKDIYIHPPGTILHLNTESIKEYWHYDFNVENPDTYEDAANNVARLFKQACERQDTKLSKGLWLSGGVDSYLLNKELSPDYTFSCVYSQKEFDERSRIEQIKANQIHCLIQ